MARNQLHSTPGLELLVRLFRGMTDGDGLAAEDSRLLVSVSLVDILSSFGILAGAFRLALISWKDEHAAGRLDDRWMDGLELTFATP